MKPLYLLSLPRSGSTLVQRILAANPNIATTSEPWLLLPLMYLRKSEGIYTDYWHSHMTGAISDFCSSFPNGEEDFCLSLRTFILDLYSKACDEEIKYFLDKTPRYHLIVEDIIRVLPDAKFVILWRNPLSIVASIINTWASGKWNIYRYHIDLYKGLNNLVAAARSHPNQIFTVKYEDLIGGDLLQWETLFAFLELEFEPAILQNFSAVQLLGHKGDQIGSQVYSTLNKEPVDKWKESFSNPLRRAWAKQYIKWIGPDRLAIMGYDQNELLSSLENNVSGTDRLVSDATRMAYGLLYQTEYYIPIKRIRNLTKEGYSYVHL